MKKINLFFLLFILFSCKEEQYSRDMIIVKEMINGRVEFKNKKALILIPLNGCGTCTRDIIEFSKSNYNNDKYIFILTGITSQNILEFRKIKYFEDYFIIDENSELVSQGIVENKPVVCFIKNEHISEVIKFDDSISNHIIQRIKDSIN